MIIKVTVKRKKIEQKRKGERMNKPLKEKRVCVKAPCVDACACFCVCSCSLCWLTSS